MSRGADPSGDRPPEQVDRPEPGATPPESEPEPEPEPEPESEPEQSATPPESESDRELRGGMVKTLLAVLVNVGVLTALLVYFGWVRSDRMAALLGIDEAILGMSVDDYVRRSVRSVVILPLVAGIAGIAWVGFDQWWRRRRATRGEDDPLVVFFARWLWAIAIGVFLLGILLWLPGYAFTYITAPLVCTGGLLLFLYGLSLRARVPGAVALAPLTDGVLRGSVALLVAVGLFWTATNYATVEGTELAHAFPATVATLPRVEVDSVEPLDVVAPGIEVSCTGDGDKVRYHYRGLRYLESTGGNYFLISDGWTPQYGVVVILPMTGEGLRFTFVRDLSGDSRDSAFPPCDESAASPEPSSTDDPAQP